MGLVIGLLGGVGSGKSTVAERMALHGAVILDADAEARAVVELPEVRRAVLERFGDDLVGSGGKLDRAELARRAFASEEGTAALNALVHPEVRRRLAAQRDAAGDRPAVLDVPLLFESPLRDWVDVWVFVDAPERARDERVAERGWAPDERRRREARQADLADKRARADHVLENSGSIDEIGQHVDALMERLGVL